LSRAIIDHGAQIVTVPPGCPEFAKQVDEWKDEGILKRFPEKSVCDIINPFDRETKQYDKSRVRLKPMAGDLYYAVNGMQAIPNAMRGNFAIEQDVWVSPNDGVRLVNRDGGKQWEIKAKGDVLGHFDKLVIAHNGKCADRLMSTTPAKDFHRLLQVNFAPYVPRDGGKRMTLNSLYSLSFAMPLDSVLSNTLPSKTFTCGFIKNHPNLRFISCNSRKHPLEAIQDVEVWTVLSSAKFGKAHKGPQENLPTELVNEVTGLMYDSIEEALALPKGSVRGPPDNAPGKGRVMESLLQLWGAAVPVNTWVSTDGADGFIYDAEYGVGACGDWLLDASVAGAWESGRRLAKFMIHGGQETMGLSGGFKASAAVDKIGIGAFQ
jgi:predicted NAD/FAD-dependent oxidoreductase